jgi:hypothetical protein
VREIEHNGYLLIAKPVEIKIINSFSLFAIQGI